MQNNHADKVNYSPPLNSRDENKWSNLVTEWEKGNESQKAFCLRLGISLNTFTYWPGKFLSKEQQENKFIPIAISQSNNEIKTCKESFVLENNSGYKLSIPISISNEKLICLLQSMGF